jgi:electron transport complex protein RnfB
VPGVPPAGATADAIDALLPQTQCRRCGYAGCRPYAVALAEGSTELNRCPPGGTATIAALAALLGRAPLPLDPACGVEEPARVARIDEALCIGCAKCLPACPVDAIVGAPKHMHTVIAAECTGCGLCLPPCPVDCIVMIEPVVPLAAPAWARSRHIARNARLARDAAEQEAALAAKAQALHRRDDPA